MNLGRGEKPISNLCAQKFDNEKGQRKRGKRGLIGIRAWIIGSYQFFEKGSMD